MDMQDWKKTGVLTLNKEDLKDPGTMQVVNNLLDKQQDAWEAAIETIANTHNISNEFAGCVWYLRTRSRWSQEYEDRLIAMAHAGEAAPNMCDWPEDYFEEKINARKRNG